MANLYFNVYDGAHSTEQAVRDAADNAMRLQPELAETLWARGGYLYCFFFNDPATTELYTLSLHDALPIFRLGASTDTDDADGEIIEVTDAAALTAPEDRKRTRLNSSHLVISYAVFCL